MRARCKHGQCLWRPTRKPGVEKCEVCGDVFPCARECTHWDCMEARGEDPATWWGEGVTLSAE